MEAIAKFSDVTVPAIVLPTREKFIPLLAARKSKIAQTSKRTFKYGPTERHQVDVYYPPSGTSNAPIFFFVYGGGFATGSRDIVPGLLFDNIGAFFAQRGILTAVADYRLAPETTYPCPAEDIRDAIRFTLTSPDVDVTRNGADKNRVYILGHSAGGSHVSTLFLNENILTDEDRRIIRGAVLMSGVYGSAPPLTMYYGNPAEEMDKKCPLGLLSQKSTDKLAQLLPDRLFLLSSERDDPILAAWDKTFREALHEKGITDYHTHTMKGHNHVSPEVSLSSGEGEEWGEEVAQWIKA
ncbi:Alpha/Beta hydrolase protein [Gautieria morchelliformis]|nr:Alpha/Beta hydrolase protein [Gautieria morchelliformis]